MGLQEIPDNLNWTSSAVSNIGGKTAIVTGANSGIGFETAKSLAGAGCDVVLACRSLSRANTARDSILVTFPDARLRVMELDLSSLESVEQFATRFLSNNSRLDMLINNAGVMVPPYQLTQDGFELQLGTNYLGHFALTGLLLQRLESSPESRVVTVSSIAHRKGRLNFDDLNSEQRYSKMKAYAQSKLACLMFAYELDRRLKQGGRQTISVAAHPGVTKSELVSHTAFIKILLVFAQETSEGALPILRGASDPALIGGEYLGPSGFLGWRGKPTNETSSRISYCCDSAARLWRISEDMTSVNYLSD